MATSRKLKIYRNTDDASTDINQRDNNSGLLLTQNNKVIKSELTCPVEMPLIKPKCDNNDEGLSLQRNECSVQPSITIDWSLLQEKCEDNRILMYNDGSSKVDNNSKVQSSNKIGFENLTLDILKILLDAKLFVNDNNHNKCFGLVDYNPITKQINFFSSKDILKKKVLGAINLNNIIEEVELKIPLISINDNTLEIQQELRPL